MKKPPYGWRMAVFIKVRISLIEEVLYFLKETFLIVIIGWLEILAILQFFQSCLFLLIQLLWCPNIYVHQHISLAIALNPGQAFAF